MAYDEDAHRPPTSIEYTEMREMMVRPNSPDRSDTTATKNVPRLLYTSHFLSTWNSRLFEFGAYLFLAELYPQTLLPASVYALTRAASAAVISPWLGRYVDTSDRLKVVRISIVGQRISVALSCLILYGMMASPALRHEMLYAGVSRALLCVLAAVEKLSAVLNTIAIERDWVVVTAGGNEDQLRALNSQMRRIDLFCKLIGPLAISFIAAASAEGAVICTAAMTVLSVAAEYFAIARVYHAIPGLQARQQSRVERVESSNTAPYLRDFCQTAYGQTVTYFRHRAFLPSFALALLYLTVLSFNGQMITYLLSMGTGAGVIGILRGVSAIFELSATWLAPILMDRIGTVRAGIWFINWQICCVAVACISLWLASTSTTAIIGTIAAVIASRVGLWGFDLSAQIIVQDEVEPELRGTFSSQEFAFQNVFEMLSFASTVVFARPEQFKYPATISAVAVGLAGVLYAAFVRHRRGHLVHWSKCMDGHHRKKHGWSRVLQDEEGGEGHELVERDIDGSTQP